VSELLEVQDLVVEYKSRGFRAAPFRAVKGVSFSVPVGRTVAIVGESGSGKSTIGRAILGLTPIASGSILFEGTNISHIKGAGRRALARDLQVIFQDPVGSLNPSKKIASTILEPMFAQKALNKEESRTRVAELLRRVNLPENAAMRYPGQFSGGQRQRIAIARALAVGPKLVICDEPTSALDVSTQARVLELLREMQRELDLSYIFISHDLAVVRELCDHVLVMRNGEIVESGSPDQICDAPRHAYTKRLVAAAPVPDPVLQRRRRQEWLSLTGGDGTIRSGAEGEAA
jgi:ABC-type glutathione transport system ATPase component